MKHFYKILLIAISALALALGAGCQKKTPEQEQTATPAPTTPADSTAPSNQAVTPPAPSAVDQAGTAVNDAAITAKVKTALIGTPELKAMEINVDTVNGVVTLTGTVDSPQTIDRAAQVAQTVDGVKSVSNQLNVKAQG